MGAFITYSATDVGTVKSMNQDSIGVIVNTHPNLNAALGVVCDGVGGLQEGEYASATTYKRFMDWFQYELPQLVQEERFESILKKRWCKLVENHNQYLYEYANGKQVRLGTTLTALLLFQGRYYTMQVGDSRAYQISSTIKQLTEDQSLVALEVRKGILTKEQARFDPRRNVLLQSIGYARHVGPDFRSGDMQEEAGYLICSDGFYHCVEETEMVANFYSDKMTTTELLKDRTDRLLELVKKRGETDNISVAVMKYLKEGGNGQSVNATMIQGG